MRTAPFGQLSCLAVLAAAGGAMAQGPSGPTANYWVTADTHLNAMAAASGAMPSLGHSLVLQLSSTRLVTGEPSAEHLPPPGLGAGSALPLVTPVAGPKATDEGRVSPVTGRVLVFWGCGTRARPGQPLSIDLARSGAGAGALATGAGPFAPNAPAPAAGRTYGEWNGGRSGQLGLRASLVGQHMVRGGYTPDIVFNLSAGQDFLPALQLSGLAPDAGGAIPLKWGAVDRAGGYFASAVGASEAGDTVIWTSSEAPILADQVPDHLSPADLQRLLARKVVLDRDTKACAIPGEVALAAPTSILRVVALGAETNFAFPPRPADPKAPWRPDYSVKVRYASTATAMLGLDGPGGGGDPDPDAESERGDQETVPGVLGLGARSLIKGLGAIGR